MAFHVSCKLFYRSDIFSILSALSLAGLWLMMMIFIVTILARNDSKKGSWKMVSFERGSREA